MSSVTSKTERRVTELLRMESLGVYVRPLAVTTGRLSLCGRRQLTESQGYTVLELPSVAMVLHINRCV